MSEIHTQEKNNTITQQENKGWRLMNYFYLTAV